MATTRYTDSQPEVDALYADLALGDLQPLWELKNLLTTVPAVRAVPHHWRGRELSALGARAGDLIPVDRGGDRRVLACCNPGLGGAPFAVGSLWAAVQYLQGGEYAPAHRHTPSALRFIVQGEGVWTLVDKDPIHMAEGDLVLTPSWTFHEHHNPGADPMIWVDVLDLPMVAALDSVFFEDGGSEEVDRSSAPSSRAEQWYGGGPGLVPADLPGSDQGTLPAHSPLLAYRWADTERALQRQLDVTDASWARIRYTDPVRGGDVMPTMRCEMDRVLRGSASTTTRQTGDRVATILHGRGQVVVGSDEFDVEPGDMVAIPSWVPWHVVAEEELDVFSTSNAPVLVALGLFRTASDDSSAVARTGNGSE